MARRLLLTTLLLLIARVAGAAPPAAGSFSLAQALSALRRGNPALQAASAAVRAAEGDAHAAGLWTNPIVDVSYGRGLRRSQYDTLGAASFGVTQFVEVAGAPSARRKAARLERAATERDGATLYLLLAADVEAAMIQLAGADERVAILTESLGTLDAMRRVVETRVAAGGAPRYDASRIAVAYAAVEADLDDAEADRALARGELDAAVGPLAGELQGRALLDWFAPVEVPDAASLVRFAETHRPDLQAAAARAQGAEVSVSVARRSVFPGFGLRVGGDFGVTPGEWDVSVGITAPLPVVDRGQGAVPAAAARATQARARESSLRSELRHRLAAGREEVARRFHALERYRANGGLDGQAMALEARASYEAGRFSALELSDAIVALRDARLRLIDLATSAHLARVELERNLGARLETIGR